MSPFIMKGHRRNRQSQSKCLVDNNTYIAPMTSNPPRTATNNNLSSVFMSFHLPEVIVYKPTHRYSTRLLAVILEQVLEGMFAPAKEILQSGRR